MVPAGDDNNTLISNASVEIANSLFSISMEGKDP